VIDGEETTETGAPVRVIHVEYEEAPGRSYTDLPNVLVNNGFRIAQFSEEAVNLETAFMRLTKGLVQ
jgi:hypothetical protein